MDYVKLLESKGIKVVDNTISKKDAQKALDIISQEISKGEFLILIITDPYDRKVFTYVACNGKDIVVRRGMGGTTFTINHEYRESLNTKLSKHKDDIIKAFKSAKGDEDKYGKSILKIIGEGGETIKPYNSEVTFKIKKYATTNNKGALPKYGASIYL